MHKNHSKVSWIHNTQIMRFTCTYSTCATVIDALYRPCRKFARVFRLKFALWSWSFGVFTIQLSCEGFRRAFLGVSLLPGRKFWTNLMSWRMCVLVCIGCCWSQWKTNTRRCSRGTRWHGSARWCLIYPLYSLHYRCFIILGDFYAVRVNQKQSRTTREQPWEMNW